MLFKRTNWFAVIFFSILFFAVMYIYASQNLTEAFTENDTAQPQTSCPTLLIRKGSILLLYNANIPEEYGVNPLPFTSLEEYVKYHNEKGPSCPVLYLQEETNASNEIIYASYPSPFDQTMPVQPIVGQDKGGYGSTDMYPSFSSVETGKYSVIEKHSDSTMLENGGLSSNPADVNWGGVGFTQSKIDAGAFSGNEVYKPVVSSSKPLFGV